MRPRLIFLFVFLVVSRAGRAESSRQALDEAKALQQKGAVAEARKRYEAMLPSLRATDRESLGKALLELGNILSAQGDYDNAIVRARESADVYRSLGDKAGEARAVYGVGVVSVPTMAVRAAPSAQARVLVSWPEYRPEDYHPTQAFVTFSPGSRGWTGLQALPKY